MRCVPSGKAEILLEEAGAAAARVVCRKREIANRVIKVHRIIAMDGATALFGRGRGRVGTLGIRHQHKA